MRNRKIQNQKTKIRNRPAVSAACLITGLILTGCGVGNGKFSLALPEVPADVDRLAGFFITTAPIEPEPPEITLNSRGELVAKQQDTRIYGVLKTDPSGQPVNDDTPQEDTFKTPVTFGGLEGYGLYSLQLSDENSPESCSTVFADDIFTDLHFTVSGEEDITEASLYVNADSPCTCYFHPVYQQPDGQVYLLLPSSGITSSGLSQGIRYSRSMSQSQSSGPTGQEESEGTCFTVTVISEAPAENTEALLMDSRNQVIETLPQRKLETLFRQGESLELPDRAAYVILQQTAPRTEKVSRRLFDHGTEYLEYRAARGDGYLHSIQIPLVWKEEAAP